MKAYIKCQTRFCKRRQIGFSLVEVLISICVLTVGLITLLGVFALAMASTQTAQQDMIAKQLAQEVMESIMTTREVGDSSGNSNWAAIQNVGSTGGIFVTGFKPINQAGTDGILGTIDDGPAEQLVLPGPSGLVTGSSPPDVIVPLANYQRKIEIVQQASGDLRAVTITIQYTTPQNLSPKTYVLSTMISQYR